MTARQPGTRMTPAGHRYYLDGEQVRASVTGITNGGMPKPQLVDWAAREAAAFVVDHWDELVAMPPSQRGEAVRTARFTTLGEAKERGTEVHTQIVRYLAGEDVVPPEGLEGHVDAAIKFVDDWQLEELLIEVPVFSRAYGYAGRLDAVADLADGHRWLLDWKTHARGPFLESALQLAAYRYADFYVVPGEADDDGQAIEHPLAPLGIERTGIVHVTAEEAVLYPFEAGPEAFALFGAAQLIAEFVGSDRTIWIGEAMRPPRRADDEAAA